MQLGTSVLLIRRYVMAITSSLASDVSPQREIKSQKQFQRRGAELLFLRISAGALWASRNLHSAAGSGGREFVVANDKAHKANFDPNQSCEKRGELSWRDP
jgi:hypothetical protein